MTSYPTSDSIAEITRKARREGWDIDRYQDAISDPSVRAPRDWSGLILGGAALFFVVAPVLAAIFGIR